MRIVTRLLVSAGLAIVTLASAGERAHGQAAPFSFGLWGDMPYRLEDEARVASLIKAMNASDLDLTIHDGDIKNGSSRCDDKSYRDAIGRFDSLDKPAIYVPGDNEWTDCHRAGDDPWERLEHLRKLMFATGMSFGKAQLKLQQQGNPGEQFSENILFVHKGIVFVGLNVPGCNPSEPCATPSAKFEALDAKTRAWLDAAFAEARKTSAPGIVVVVQANPGFGRYPLRDPCSPDPNANADHLYARFLDRLACNARSFSGQVLFVHGDTHRFRKDKPLAQRAEHAVSNLTRVETFGEQCIHWVKVTVNHQSAELFSVVPMIIAEHPQLAVDDKGKQEPCARAN